tara:strand:- start:1328 stop:1651 length:324 start_codon:yes stop_codon:yes gene_type:complete
MGNKKKRSLIAQGPVSANAIAILGDERYEYLSRTGNTGYYAIVKQYTRLQGGVHELMGEFYHKAEQVLPFAEDVKWLQDKIDEFYLDYMELFMKEYVKRPVDDYEQV